MGNLSQYFGDAVASGQSQYTTDPRLLPVGVYGYGYIKTWSNTNDNASEEVFWYNSIPKMLHMYNDQWSTVYTDHTWGNPNFTDANATNHSSVDNFEATNESGINGGYRIVDYTTQANTYVSVCDHSGFSGYLTWVIGLGNHGQPIGSKSYIKITVDGQAYEFVGNLHYRNGSATSSIERLYWGCITHTGSTGTSDGGMFGHAYSSLGAGNHHRSYYYTKNDRNIITRPEEGINLPHPEEAIPSRGFPALRFSNSIKVEVKIEAPSGGTYATNGSANYFSNYAAAAICKDVVVPGY